MDIVIHPNFSKDNAFETTSKVCSMLHDCGMGLYSYTKLSDRFPPAEGVVFGEEDDVCRKADVIIAIGGDGTILEASHYASRYDKLLLGINTGRLGFMASLEYDELHKLSVLLSGDYTVQERMLLDCVYTVGGEEQVFTALNDVVLSSRFGHIADFTVNIGDMTVSRTRADGLIFSTPTGSTAYALSAGGPILSPDIRCIQMTPVCSHSLFSRTMIFSPDKQLDVTADISRTEIFLTVDGIAIGSISERDTVCIRSSEKVLRLMDIEGDMFFKAVNTKLMTPMK